MSYTRRKKEERRKKQILGLLIIFVLFISLIIGIVITISSIPG